MQTMQNATSTQEEQGLEKGVCEQVEHARANAVISRTGYTQTNKHIAQLTDRREGQHAFEIGLDKRDGGGKEGRNATDPGHHTERFRTCRREKWRCTCNHIDTSSDHRRGVDECTDGCWTFHSGGEPDVQRNLRRLTDSTTEDEDHRNGQQRWIQMSNYLV